MDRIDMCSCRPLLFFWRLLAFHSTKKGIVADSHLETIMGQLIVKDWTGRKWAGNLLTRPVSCFLKNVDFTTLRFLFRLNDPPPLPHSSNCDKIEWYYVYILLKTIQLMVSVWFQFTFAVIPITEIILLALFFFKCLSAGIN